MSKTYKGYELFKAIEEGEIEDWAIFRFRCAKGEGIFKFWTDEESLFDVQNNRNIMVDYTLLEIVCGTFELIEEILSIIKGEKNE